MESISFYDFSSKKAFEIAYALARIAGSLPNRNFAEHLEKHSLDLLASVAARRYGGIRELCRTLEYLLELGSSVNLVSGRNTLLIRGEIRILAAAIAEFKDTEATPDVNVEEIFSKNSAIITKDDKNLPPLFKTKESPVYSEKMKENINPETVSGLSGKEEHLSGDIRESAIPAATGKSIESRQSAILRIIRQHGICRLKEIQESFPEVSDRTLRYDLQKLADQRFVEKSGSGPATFYQIKSEFLGGHPSGQV